MKYHDQYIRNANLDDASEILEIQKEAFLGQAKIYNNYELPPLTQEIESLREEYKEKIVLKYEVQNRIIGSVRYKDEDGTVTVDRLVVKPSEQSKGIGTRLLQAVEEMNPEATKFRLFTGNKSERNIHLYKNVGYKEIGRSFTDQGIQLIYMEKIP